MLASSGLATPPCGEPRVLPLLPTIRRFPSPSRSSTGALSHILMRAFPPSHPDLCTLHARRRAERHAAFSKAVDVRMVLRPPEPAPDCTRALTPCVPGLCLLRLVMLPAERQLRGRTRGVAQTLPLIARKSRNFQLGGACVPALRAASQCTLIARVLERQSLLGKD